MAKDNGPHSEKAGYIGPAYSILGLRSLDGPAREFTQSFVRTLVLIVLVGVLLALVFTLITAYSLTRPLRALVAQLNHTQASGDLSERLTAGTGVRELAHLADAYNGVAESAQRARRQLEHAKDEAQCANRLKDEFLANISHELRTPLNGMLGMTDLLLDSPLNAEQQDFAVTVRKSGEALASIIDDVLTFSALQTGRLKLSTRRFDLESLLGECAEWTKHRAEMKNLRVDMRYSHSAQPVFIGDEMSIRQVLRQLCETDSILDSRSSGALISMLQWHPPSQTAQLFLTSRRPVQEQTYNGREPHGRCRASGSVFTSMFRGLPFLPRSMPDMVR